MSKYVAIYVSRTTNKVLKYQLIPEDLTKEYIEKKMESWNANKKRDAKVLLEDNQLFIQALELKEDERSMKYYAREITDNIEKYIQSVSNQVDILKDSLSKINDFINQKEE